MGVGAVCAGVDWADAAGDSCFGRLVHESRATGVEKVIYSVLLKANTAVAKYTVLIRRTPPSQSSSSTSSLSIVVESNHDIPRRRIVQIAGLLVVYTVFLCCYLGLKLGTGAK